jgi:hypothetical protein
MVAPGTYMDKTNTILGVLTALYAAYIGIALWRSRARELARHAQPRTLGQRIAHVTDAQIIGASRAR